MGTINSKRFACYIYKKSFKRATEEEQILLDKTETEAGLKMDLKVHFKMPDHKNDMKNGATWDLPMELPVVLTIKGDILITNQKSDLNSFAAFLEKVIMLLFQTTKMPG